MTPVPLIMFAPANPKTIGAKFNPPTLYLVYEAYNKLRRRKIPVREFEEARNSKKSVDIEQIMAYMLSRHQAMERVPRAQVLAVLTKVANYHSLNIKPSAPKSDALTFDSPKMTTKRPMGPQSAIDAVLGGANLTTISKSKSTKLSLLGELPSLGMHSNLRSKSPLTPINANVSAIYEKPAAPTKSLPIQKLEAPLEVHAPPKTELPQFVNESSLVNPLLDLNKLEFAGIDLVQKN